jgi:hypothetical protein
MRKSIIASQLIALMFVMTSFAMAGDIKTDIAGHTYAVTLSGTLYEIFFEQGPFGPGPCGTATLKADGKLFNTYSFYTQGNLVVIEKLGNFYYTDWKLIWIQGELLTLYSTGTME